MIKCATSFYNARIKNARLPKQKTSDIARGTTSLYPGKTGTSRRPTTPPAVTGSPVAPLRFRLSAPLRSHVPPPPGHPLSAYRDSLQTRHRQGTLSFTAFCHSFTASIRPAPAIVKKNDGKGRGNNTKCLSVLLSCPTNRNFCT